MASLLCCEEQSMFSVCVLGGIYKSNLTWKQADEVAFFLQESGIDAWISG